MQAFYLLLSNDIAITFPLEEPPAIKRTIFSNVNIEACKCILFLLNSFDLL